MSVSENELNPASMRQAFLSCLGNLPLPSPLEVIVEEQYEGDTYIRERISYQASPGVRVPAYVLAPRRLTKPTAAIVCIHQHNGEFHIGKSEPVGLAGNPDVFYALELCQRGYIVIVPDQEGFEERQASTSDMEIWKRTVPRMLAEGEYERYLAMGHLLRGSSLQARYVWDLARTVDYLFTRPDVDTEHIGALGHSLGGQEVCWLLLFDSRVRVGVCSCGVSTFEAIMRNGINHNFAAYTPGMLEVGDMDKLIAELAPTPLLLTAGAQDWIFPIDGVRQIAQAARLAYEQAAAPRAFRYHEFTAGHSFPSEVRQLAYSWLDRWLHI
ncbi:alpha/beta hydrolase family protein [Dictyobacter kobayashii]|uniref:Hydrolase n=1 Tax=Dictyobacter kobayashii TaxID=2014872 RepID=A0A402AD80_9CHLR|nr:alpha/beta fold hydrolase [Dictyobacter kobayashii]GCE17062.1 hydrolase [Dictyobacter kobayashii]